MCIVVGVTVYASPQTLWDEEYTDQLIPATMVLKQWFYVLGKAPSLEELDPNTKEYWRKVRTLGMRRNNQLSKLKKF
jgi:hypothetical protein